MDTGYVYEWVGGHVESGTSGMALHDRLHLFGSFSLGATEFLKRLLVHAHALGGKV